MPRVKRSVRRYKKKTLKKSNIFAHKSAKSQAKQIYALNKRVNTIYKKTAPEITRFAGCLVNKWFTTDSTSNGSPYNRDHGFLALFSDGVLGANGNHYQMKGNDLKPQYIRFWGNFGIQDSTGLTMVNADNIPGINTNHPAPCECWLRLIFAYPKAGGGAQTPNSFDLFLQNTPGWDNTRGITDPSIIMGPLPENLSERLTIIKDKKIKLGDVKRSTVWKYKIKYPKNYKKSPRHPTTDWSPEYGEVLVYWAYYCPSILNLYGTTSGGQTIQQKLSPRYFSINYTVGLIDQN